LQQQRDCFSLILDLPRKRLNGKTIREVAKAGRGAYPGTSRASTLLSAIRAEFVGFLTAKEYNNKSVIQRDIS
jgi:hypothetical protein